MKTLAILLTTMSISTTLFAQTTPVQQKKKQPPKQIQPQKPSQTKPITPTQALPTAPKTPKPVTQKQTQTSQPAEQPQPTSEIQSQQPATIPTENISGGFESFNQLYQNDPETGAYITKTDPHFRSNQYFKTDYTRGAFSAGFQYEAYLPQLLGYSPALSGNGAATYYGNFKVDFLEVTAGFFYDQFGSGLVFRSWEDRQIGINNAIKGVKVKVQPTEYLSLTGLSGNHRVGFGTSKGQLNAFNAELDAANMLNFSNLGLRFGTSYVGRYVTPDSNIPGNVGAYSGRADVDLGGLNLGVEYVYKEKDLRKEATGTDLKHFDSGSGILATLGYSKKGFGFTAQYRRLENMGFYSDTDPDVVNNSYSTQVVNYLPALTKQHDYNVANLYRYSSHGALIFNEGLFGENGGQADLFFILPKGSTFGGRFGTKIAINYSVWYGLGAKVNSTNGTYIINKEFDKKYFQDINLEIKKKWDDYWTSTFAYINLFYNATIPGISPINPSNTQEINANIVAFDLIRKWNYGKSTRILAEHLSTAQDVKNWASGTLEHAFSSRYSMYVTDLYNYGNPISTQRLHYYTVGAAVTKGPTRIALAYGRQRGGLICSGGVCRMVPANTGLNLSIVTTF